jgi:hypothetical protein
MKTIMYISFWLLISSLFIIAAGVSIILFDFFALREEVIQWLLTNNYGINICTFLFFTIIIEGMVYELCKIKK